SSAANASVGVLLHEVGEGAELGFACDAGAILLVRLFLGVFFHRADGELRLSATRVDVENLRLEARANRELLAQIGAALRAGVTRGDERARRAPRDAEDTHDEAALHHLRNDGLDRAVRRDLLLWLVRFVRGRRRVQADAPVRRVAARDHE